MKTYKGVLVQTLPLIKPKRESRRGSLKIPYSRLPVWELEEQGDPTKHPEHPTRVLQRAQWQLTFEELSRLHRSDTSLKRDIRKCLKAAHVKHYDLSEKAFASTYKLVTTELDRRFAMKERRVSLNEWKFDKYLDIALEKKRKYFSQFWMGRYNVDFWIPWARNQSNLSLIVEVCGGIYNDKIKQVKFGKKCSFIEKELRIPIMAINAEDATFAKAQEIVRDQLTKRDLGSKTYKRLLHKIHIVTLAAWIDELHDAYFEDYFGLNRKHLCMIRDLVLRTKKTSRFENLSNIELLRTSTSQTKEPT